MTALSDIIINQIKRFGPMPVSEYMTLCLLHPEHGYYTNRDALGASGDFTTAPEISQMFGELIGLTIAQAWIDQGMPKPFVLAELGPGNGTLMADILRATKSVPKFHSSMDLHLIEASPEMRKRQKSALDGFCVTWLDYFSELPQKPLFLVANEFFDCLPIKQYRRTAEGWQEQMIGADENQLHFILGTATSEDVFTKSNDIPNGDMLEISASSVTFASAIGEHVNTNGGCAIIIDYGEWDSDGDSLQAIQNHNKIDPLTNCGAADLTAHVSFRDLTNAASKHAKVSSTIPQGILLERLGITQRAQTLAKNIDGKALETHISAHKRLTHPDEMGKLFKAIAIIPNHTDLPTGFN
ncbi:SAM-dependent methyltransferase [Amylibacter sp.]|nr:SAM-dependent methyltransferase [Amylibacter sp.]